MILLCIGILCTSSDCLKMVKLVLSCHTPFHHGPHQPYSCPQGASCIWGVPYSGFRRALRAEFRLRWKWCLASSFAFSVHQPPLTGQFTRWSALSASTWKHSFATWVILPKAGDRYQQIPLPLDDGCIPRASSMEPISVSYGTCVAFIQALSLEADCMCSIGAWPCWDP